MSKRISFLILIFSPLALSAQKNVLFIVVDDLKPILSAYNDTLIYTPNIDRIAEKGTTFLNASCQQALCAPSRASVLTGMYPDELEFWSLDPMLREKNPDVITLPQFFKENDYFSTGRGKMFHRGTVDNGFDTLSWSETYRHTVSELFYDSTTGPGYKSSYHNPLVKTQDELYHKYLKENDIRNDAGIREALSMFPYANPSTEGWDVNDDSYRDGAVATFITKKMLQLKKQTEPFFLAVGFIRPHLPLIAPKKYWDLYDRKTISIHPEQTQPLNVPSIAWRTNDELASKFSDIRPDGVIDVEKQKELIHAYMACVSYVDAQIGKLLDQLDQLGFTENTIIVLWSDHGWHLGDHNLWSKRTNFEQAVRTPLIISDPDIGIKGNKSNSPVELVDIYPTLAQLTGLSPPKHIQGKSLVPVMKDGSARVRKAALSQYPRILDDQSRVMGYTLRDERYRYTKWLRMNFEQGERSGSLIGLQLYDLVEDPFEMNNLIDKKRYKDVIQNFESIFKARGVAQTKSLDESFVYPNPSKKVIYLSLEEDLFSVELYDDSGRLTKVYPPKQRRLEIDDLAPGVYYLVAYTTSNHFRTNRVVVSD